MSGYRGSQCHVSGYQHQVCTAVGPCPAVGSLTLCLFPPFSVCDCAFVYVIFASIRGVAEGVAQG